IRPRAIGIPWREGPINVATEYVERRQVAGRSRGFHGSTVTIDGRVVAQDIGSLHAGKIAEYTLSCLVGEHCSREVPFREVPLPIKQEKEKRLVLDDRTAEPSAKLIAVVIVFSDTLKIVIPGICGEL